jgi:outer membrane lipoprotein SlyB
LIYSARQITEIKYAQPCSPRGFMKNTQVVTALFLAATTLMSGCANTDSRPVSSYDAPARITYGVIDNIEITQGSNNEIGAGTVIGGIVGGVLGHQVGAGSGNDVATVAGAVGGAVVGHQVEKQNRQQDSYRIQIRLERGGYQTVTQGVSDLRVGDRVRIENNHVSRY